VEGEEVWVTAAGSGVEGDPQEERRKESKSNVVRKRRSVDKV
jgi:hypothetical protein